MPNVRVSHDRYGVHVEPSVAVNPHNPRQLLAAAQVSPGADPEFLATYLSSDAGLTWQPGAVPKLPVGANGDDVTVAFDVKGRGYVCATSDEGGRAIYDVAIPGAVVRVEMLTSALAGRGFKHGDRVKIDVSPETSVLLPAD